MVTAADRGAFLQDLFWKSQEQEVSLFSLLKAALQTAIAQASGTASGNRQLITVAGQGRTSSFAIPDFYKFMTSDEYRQMFYLFVQIYQSALTTLSLTQPADYDASHDQAVFNAMIADDRMQKCDSYHIDHTLGRWPSGAGFTT